MLIVIQTLVAMTLIAIILLQAKGTGLGSTFGGQSQMYHSKKGAEKAIFYLTIALAIIFVVLSLINFRL
jgi:preprotein translocase subunit SecG